MQKLINPLLSMPRRSKRLIAVGVDVSLCFAAVWLAYYLRLGEWTSLSGRPMIAVALSIVLALPIFSAAGIYRIVFRYVGFEVMMAIAFASVVYGLCYFLLISVYGFIGVPRTLGIIQPVLLFLGVALSRVAAGYWLGGRYRRLSPDGTARRVLVYGAGSAGQQLVMALSDSAAWTVVGYLDEDVSLQGSRLRGVPVFNPDQLKETIARLQVGDVLLAIPSASRRRRMEIIDQLRGLSVGVRTLPGLIDLAHGHVQASDLRELTIEDLLERDPVEPQHLSWADRIAGQTVMITGAGGSIGSELCRQIAAAGPANLVLLELNEFSLYSIHRELEKQYDFKIIPLLGSVVDQIRVRDILRAFEPSIVFHAAAYKHVPLVEHNPLEGIRNNVLGTECVAQAALEYGVRDFVLISTDKAVRPTNIMGATKRLAELVLQALSVRQSKTRFSMVRFGNVLGSSGSVVPLFRDQIKSGGPVTLTHQDITRYFMTIPEAAQLVIHASAMATGGEVFVLDMGSPVKIYQLARNMIELSGLKVRDANAPDGDIEIVTVGLRPGEKLYEELLIGEHPQTTDHPRIMKANEHFLVWDVLGPRLDELATAIEQSDVAGARKILSELVPEFAPTIGIVDWVQNERGQPPSRLLIPRGEFGVGHDQVA